MKTLNGMPLFSPADFPEAHEKHGAMCGHGALAAALQIPVMDVMKHFPQGGWINIPMMREAIMKAGFRSPRVDRPARDIFAVTIVQFEGRWTEPGVPPAAACRHRHWIAERVGLVWDINWPDWQSLSSWDQCVPELQPEGCTGFKYMGSYEIRK